MLGSSRRMLSTPRFRRLMPKFIRWCTRLGGARYGAGRGQVFPIMAGGLFVLIGFVGMAFDLGIARNARRQMQNAADAAAIAAAQALGNGQDYFGRGEPGSRPERLYLRTKHSAEFLPCLDHHRHSVGRQLFRRRGGHSGNTQPVAADLLPAEVLKVSTRSQPKRSAVGYAKSGTACIYSLDPSGGGAMFQ